MPVRTKAAPAAPAVARPAAECSDPLQRPFRAIVFDWDGTAVENRQADATALAGLAQALLRAGVWLVVVTGTHFGNIDQQFCRLLPAGSRRRLLVCTNRGSEVYGFDRRGNSVRRWLRTATPAEDAALTATAEAVRAELVARTGLDVQIVSSRLNRRKLDLMPLPAWADPPKSQIGALLAATEARLYGGGLAGGLQEAIALAARAAAAHGLPAARVTSDAKHVEIGLTDKADSAAWLARVFLPRRRLAPADMLIAGDEFGLLPGLAGSDDRLRAHLDGATVVSVGVEPDGVPDGVRLLGGGPARFRALLADQVWRHRRQRTATRPAPPVEAAHEEWFERTLRPPVDPGWALEEHGFEPTLEREVESRLAVGNGFLGVRGSIGQPTPASLPRTYVAGLFATPPGASAQPALVPAPDWLRVQFDVDGVPTVISAAAAPTHPRVLDFGRGLLLSTWTLRDGTGPIGRLHGLRFVSQAARSVAVQVVRVEAERPVWIALGASLGPAGEGLLPALPAPGGQVWRTAHSGRFLALVERCALHQEGRALPVEADGGDLRQRWGWVATPDEPAVFTRIVAFAKADSAGAAERTVATTLAAAQAAGVRGLLSAHVRAWAERWAASDVGVLGDADAQRALRFAAYQLLSAANPADERVSIGARALSGDAYLGHVFWDTEIFLLPFYTYTWPEAARALLMYRYHTLPAARAKAARLGYRGALFAWESTDTGEEATPPFVIGPDGQVVAIRCGVEEHHISAAVAYAVWQYWQATRDRRFLLDAGAELLLETARFWASRAALEADGRYHIRGVIGPDEYHEGVDDNAYTNGMAIWTIERGLEVARLLVRRFPTRWAALRTALALEPAELAHWAAVAAGLVTGRTPGGPLLEQFAGFFGLETIDLTAYAARTAPMDVVLGSERTRRSQVIKQADVVMLLALLWARFTPAEREANFRYYEARCGHGSSLSPAIHALVAARLGDVDLAQRYFGQAATIDLGDTMGNVAGGVHIATQGGLWQAAVFGFAGLQPGDAGLRFDPHLPEDWQALRFAVRWRGRVLRVALEASPAACTFTLERGRPLWVAVGGVRCRLTRAVAWTCRWDRRGQRWLEVTL